MKRLHIITALLFTITLFAYNNCGGLQNNKTSTQATNPGDFGDDGGDSGGGNSTRMLIRRLISDLCTLTTSIDTNFDFTECGLIAETQPYVVQTFYDDPSILNLNILAEKINNGELFINGALMSECNAHIDNFQIQDNNIDLYGIDLAIAILSKSPACLSFIYNPQRESQK